MSRLASSLVKDLERLLAEGENTAILPVITPLISSWLEELHGEISARLPPKDISIYNELAALLDACGYPGEADTLLAAAVKARRKRSVERARLLNQRGILAAQHGDLVTATGYFEEALSTPGLRKNPELQQVMRANLADVALRRGDLQGAGRLADLAKSTAPGACSAVLEVTLASISFQIAQHRADRDAMAAAVRALAAATRRRISELNVDSAQALVLVGDLAGAIFAVERSNSAIARAEEAADVLSVTALRLSAILGRSDPHTLETAAGAAIAQLELAREEGSFRRIEQAGRQIKSAHEQAAAVLGARDPIMLTLMFNLAVADVELARAQGSATVLAEATGHLRTAVQRVEDVLGPDAAPTLEAQANLAIAELDSARASREPERVAAAVTRLAMAYDRVHAGLGAQHPLAVLLDASLQFGRDLTEHSQKHDSALSSRAGTGALSVTGTTTGHWGMDNEYLSAERAVDELAARDKPAQAPPENRHPAVGGSRQGMRSGGGQRTVVERTFVMVKPDAVERRLIGEIVKRIECKGIRVVTMDLRTLPRELVEEHYAEHQGKPFFEPLVSFVLSGPVVAMIVEGHRCIEAFRTLSGATDPVKAAPGTIRGDLATDVGTTVVRNLVHGSDSPASAEREIKLFFPDI